jgi:hypothetical protein
MSAQDIIEQLRAALPPIFLGPSVDERTGEAVVWSTMQNLHSRGLIPDEVFTYSGRKKLILREPFLQWFGSTLTNEPPIPKSKPPLRRRNSTSAPSKAA